jgi:hypothetical protein
MKEGIQADFAGGGPFFSLDCEEECGGVSWAGDGREMVFDDNEKGAGFAGGRLWAGAGGRVLKPARPRRKLHRNKRRVPSRPGRPSRAPKREGQIRAG